MFKDTKIWELNKKNIQNSAKNDKCLFFAEF